MKCKHYNGYLEKTCKAGMDYRKLVGGPDLGWAARLPCIPDSPLRKGPIQSCSKYETYTPEEQRAIEKEHKERSEYMFKAIKTTQSLGLYSGEIECPKCKNQLTFSKARSNGHIWGRCKTDGCLLWMM